MADVIGGAAIVRGPVTWYCYLLRSFFVFMLTIQGNVVPFLKLELGLSYRAIGLHASAIAVGAILVGLVGDKVLRRFGRRRVLTIGTLLCAGGAFILCLAWSAWVSIAGCALIGLGGSTIPTVVFAVISDMHGEKRNIAINESAAFNYGLAILAPLLTSLSIFLSLGWRPVVLLGAAMGIGILFAFRGTTLPEPAKAKTTSQVHLPPAYWAFWWAVCFAVAIEFCILLWSPEFLEKIVRLSQSGAAASMAVFVAGMFLGRVSGSFLARIIAADRLLLGQLAVTLMGFMIYWTVQQPPLAIGGLFVVGLGVSGLFPSTVGLALGAAGQDTNAGSARVTVAFGLALLIVPPLLGSLADSIGLQAAHWLVPILISGALAAFIVGQALCASR